MIGNRNDFERNMNLLAEELRLDQIRFTIESKKTVHSLMDVRIAPNGRINLLTINEMARVTSMMVSSKPLIEQNEKRKDSRKVTDNVNLDLDDEDFGEDDEN